MSKKKPSIEITPSSGNVFADLKLENPDEYLVKAELAYEINKLIKEQGLTQTLAADALGIDQPKISALARGKVSGFSIERLFRFLIILGQDIEIILKPQKKMRPTKRHYTHLHVRQA